MLNNIVNIGSVSAKRHSELYITYMVLRLNNLLLAENVRLVEEPIKLEPYNELQILCGALTLIVFVS